MALHTAPGHKGHAQHHKGATMASSTRNTTTTNTQANAAQAVALPSGTQPGWGTQQPTQPCHAQAITGRQLAAKLGVATGTIRRHRRALGITNSGTGYNPQQQRAIAKAVAKAAAAKGQQAAPAAQAQPAQAAPAAPAAQPHAGSSNAQPGNTRAARRRAAAAASLGQQQQGSTQG